MSYPAQVRRWGIGAGIVGTVLGLASSAAVIELALRMWDTRAAGRIIAIFVPAVLAVTVIGTLVAARVLLDWRVARRWRD